MEHNGVPGRGLLGINKKAFEIVQLFLAHPEEYGVNVQRLPSGATVIDTGLKARGGYSTGLRVTEIAMGGLGTANLSITDFDGLKLPSVTVETSYPKIALFASQLAGWKIKVEGYAADGSGPARALSGKPGSVFRKIGYRDTSDTAVLLLEGETMPSDNAALEVAKACGVDPSNLYLVLTSTTSLAGSIQISGRIVEIGLFRLDFLGLDPDRVLYGSGCAPIMPIHPDMGRSMGRSEDALSYGGITSFVVDVEDDNTLKGYTEKAPSSNSRDYGRLSYDIYKTADFDFTKVDPAIFAPAVMTMNNVRTGSVFSAGRVNSELLKRSLLT